MIKHLIQVGKLEKSNLMVCMKSDKRRTSSHFFLVEESSGCVAEISLTKAGYTHHYPGKNLPLTEEICEELNAWMHEKNKNCPDSALTNWQVLILMWNCLNPDLVLTPVQKTVVPYYSKLYQKERYTFRD